MDIGHTKLATYATIKIEEEKIFGKKEINIAAEAIARAERMRLYLEGKKREREREARSRIFEFLQMR